MACKVIYNSSNNVTNVFADNGAPSILWQDLKETVGNGNTAYDNYVITQTQSFKKLKTQPEDLDKNNEPTLEFVMNNISITPEDTADVADTSKDTKKPNENLDLAMRNYLEQIGVNVNIVNQITDREGNPMTSIATADMLKKVVSVVNGKADISTLPEEAAHFFVEILESTGNPLFKSMYNAIPNYNIYQKTVVDYGDKKDYQGNDHKIRKEAIGKLIAQKIVNQFETQEEDAKLGRFERWMKKVMNTLKKFFGNTTSFDRAAFEVLGGAINEAKNDASVIQGNEVYEQSDNTVNEQSRVVESFKVDHKALRKAMINKMDIKGLKIIKEFTKGEEIERYIYTDPDTGKESTITNRTTDDSNRSFIKFVRDILKKDPMQVNSKESSVFARNQGTELHAVYQNLVENYSNSKTFKNVGLENIHNENVLSLDAIKSKVQFRENQGNIYKNSSWINMRAGVRDVIKGIDEKQKEINGENGTGKAKILTEVQIYDPKKDKAGTIDMVVVYSDGSVSIYDWKNFINPYRDYISKPGAKAQLIKSFTDSKIDGWNTQIGVYKNMLKEKLGIENFRELRIIPVHVQFEAPNWREGDYTPNNKIEAAYMGNKGEYGNEFLRQISVANEITGYDGMDKLIKKLSIRKNKIKESLRNRKGKKLDFAKTKVSLKIIEDQIQKLIVDKDLLKVLNEAGNNAARVSKHAGILDPRDPNYLTPAVLRNARNDADMFKVIVAESLDYVDNLIKSRELSGKEAIALKKSFSKASQDIENHGVIIKNALFNRAIDIGKKYDENLKVKPVKISATQSLFTQMSQINHPVFKTAYREINHSFNKTKAITDSIFKNIQELLEGKDGEGGIKGWGKKEDAYKMMIKDTIKDGKITSRNLVGKYSKEFLDELDRRKESGKPEDIKWIKDNFKIKQDTNESFLEDKKWYLNQQELNHGSYSTTNDIGEERIEEKRERAIDLAMKNWDESNNVWKHDSAWLNKATFRYLEPKNPEAHYNDQYRTMLQPENAPVLAFYDYHIKLNEKFKKESGLDINRNFIANRRDDVINTIINRGFNMGEFYESISSSFLTHSNEEIYYATDENGNRISKIPVLYLNPLKDKNDALDPSLKSIDLGQSLYLLANSIYNHRHMSEIESNILTLGDYLEELGNTTTDGKGNIIYEGGEQVTTDRTEKKTTDLYERFLKYYVYGQKIQSEDVQIGPLSLAKSTQALMSVYSAKVLSFAIAPAIAARVVGGINMWIETIDGFNYTREQMRAAQKMLLTNSKAFNAFGNYFDPYQQGLTWKKANDLSMKAASRVLDLNQLYLPLRGADENMDAIVAVAMAMNHAVDPETGSLERLEDLPKGTKSMWDSWTENLKDGSLVIEHLTQDAYEDFRLRVKEVMGGIKGSMDEQNITAVDTYLIGKALMQFKSWMPKLVEERFMATKYNSTFKALEEGRYRGFFKGSGYTSRNMLKQEMAFNEILVHNAKRGVDALLNLAMLKKWTTNPAERARLIEDGKWSDKQQAEYERRTKGLDLEFAEWQKNLPDGDSAKSVSRTEYLKMRQRSVRRTLAEIRAILIMMGAAMAMGMGFGPDDDKWYRQYWATRKAHLIFSRSAQELGFLLNPQEFVSMLRGGLPLMGMFVDLMKIGTNGISETGELLGIIQGSANDKTPFLYHTVKFVPGFNQLNKIIEFNDAGSVTPRFR